MNKYDILVAGELNADIILSDIGKPPRFSQEQRADSFNLTLGSSSAIFASNCSSLGAKVVFCGKTGDDLFGNFMIRSLAEKGVQTDYIVTDKTLQTGVTVAINYQGDRMMVTHPGAMESFETNEIPLELFKQTRHLHISSVFFQPGVKKNLTSLLMTAKNHGLTTSLDSQWDPDEKWDLDLENILPALDFFLPNEQELMNLTGSDQLADALEKMKYYPTCIVVKRGHKGALLQENGIQISVPAHNVSDVVDVIGAGDSFNAGFIHAFLKNKDRKKCLAFGNLTAAVSTTAAGGTSAITSYEQVIKTGQLFG